MPQDFLFAAIVLDNYLDKTLDYSVPPSLQAQVKIGARVSVPLRGKIKKGYIWQIKNKSDVAKVYAIYGLLPHELWLPPSLLELARFVANYYIAPFWNVLRYLMPPAIRKETKPPQRVDIKLAAPKELILQTIASYQNKFPLQAKILEIVLNEGKVSLQELMKRARSSISPIDSLVRKKFVTKEKKALLEELPLEYLPTYNKPLSLHQQKAFDQIAKNLDQNLFHTFLLFGVTGSGKTEVYLQLTQRALQQKKTVLLMVPEVALTSQLIETFKARLQEKVAVWHHKKSTSERYQTWQMIKKGDAKVIIGARSSIFCPCKVGLIIVDEEHDTSYKQQEEIPCYHARDLAIYRAKLEEATVVLGSATPSIESFYRAEKGKYTLCTLPERAQKASLPKIRIIDQRETFAKAGRFTHFSDTLLNGIKKRTELGEQTLILLNRRGYYNMQLCLYCGHQVSCPSCSRSLTYHKKENILLCHLCGYHIRPYLACPECKKEGLEYKGFGTQHVQAALHTIFPDIRILRMDRDTTGQKEAHEKLYNSFRSGKADVLIGTQMISKGFHFPQVTLVGILQADSSLSIPDFRSEESLFQQIVQVSGRAGRAELEGEVIIQTFRPEHDMIKLAAQGEYLPFYKKQIEERKLFSYPPFTRIIKVMAFGEKEEEVKKALQEFRHSLNLPGATLTPPSSCGHAKIKNKYRFQFLIFCRRILPVTKMLQQKRYKVKGVIFHIDVDPTSTFL